MQSIIEHFKPVFYFHSGEDVMPCDYTRILANGVLMCDKNPVLEHKPGVTDNQYITELVNYSKNVNNVHVRVPEHMYPGDMVNACLYAWYRDTDKYHVLSYIVTFAYNKNTVLGAFGAHDIDVEHVTMRIDKSQMCVHDMYFAAHGYYDGVWCTANEIEFCGSHPIVYCAQTSHAMYNKAGSYVMGYGTTVDKCEKGLLWDTNKISVLTDTQPYWLQLNIPVQSIGLKHYVQNMDEPPYSNTPFRRFTKVSGDMLFACKKYKL
jgi:hypothetical protein